MLKGEETGTVPGKMLNYFGSCMRLLSIINVKRQHLKFLYLGHVLFYTEAN